jgi:hypothetical protein
MCDQCRQPVWIYETPTGDPVALDDAPGEMLIDRRNKAYRSLRQDGYRPHRCSEVTWRAPLSAHVSGRDFLWP